MSTTSNTPHKPSAKELIIGLSVLLWLTLTLLGLWWFQQQTLRPFIAPEDDARLWQAQATEALFQTVLQQLPADSSDVVLLHFWNPDCLCNQVSQRHFNGILEAFNSDELSVIAITSEHTSAEQIAEFNRLNGQRMTLLQIPAAQLPLSASPGLALFNRVNGEYRMGYFGAYGFGALCSVANDDFFPNIIRNLQRGPYGPFMNVAGDGCFCSWEP